MSQLSFKIQFTLVKTHRIEGCKTGSLISQRQRSRWGRKGVCLAIASRGEPNAESGHEAKKMSLFRMVEAVVSSKKTYCAKSLFTSIEHLQNKIKAIARATLRLDCDHLLYWHDKGNPKWIASTL